VWVEEGRRITQLSGRWQLRRPILLLEAEEGEGRRGTIIPVKLNGGLKPCQTNPVNYNRQ